MDDTTPNTETGGLVALAADIVSAYVSNNSVPASELPGLISSIHGSLAGLGGPSASSGPSSTSGFQQNNSQQSRRTTKEPAVPIRKSVGDDYIVCLEDGKKFKSLRRHLRSSYNMTPEQYREKWNLPSDYPMVAPNYAAARSKLAKAMGLGSSRKPGKAA